MTTIETDFVPVTVPRSENLHQNVEPMSKEDPARLINRLEFVKEALMDTHSHTVGNEIPLRDSKGKVYGTRQEVSWEIDGNPLKIITSTNVDGATEFRSIYASTGTPVSHNENWITVADGANPTVQAPKIGENLTVKPNSVEAVTAVESFTDSLVELIEHMP